MKPLSPAQLSPVQQGRVVFDGVLLRTKRIEFGLTQDDLARRLGTNRWTIQRWENNRVPISEPIAEELLRVFREIAEAHAALTASFRALNWE